MSFVSCCKNLLKRYSDQQRSVICRNWLLPIRVTTVLSLIAHLVYRYYHPPQFYTVVLIIIHCTIALLLLAECSRSERYHRTVAEFNRGGLSADEYPPENEAKQ